VDRQDQDDDPWQPIPAAGHFTMNEEPGRIAELILEMVSADAGR
jgi:pimeloyl-ACP methyl ester carboxylesterase